MTCTRASSSVPTCAVSAPSSTRSPDLSNGVQIGTQMPLRLDMAGISLDLSCSDRLGHAAVNGAPIGYARPEDSCGRLPCGELAGRDDAGRVAQSYRAHIVAIELQMI